jgi:predicted  nucleic acid-binding Zn-ribbon protein
MTELETRLLKALEGLSERLELMTKNYRLLSDRTKSLSERLERNENQMKILTSRLGSMTTEQHELLERLESLQKWLSE